MLLIHCLQSSDCYNNTLFINRNILMPRLRRTVADRKRLLTKVIEGLGQHGMVRSMVVVITDQDDDGLIVLTIIVMTMIVAMMMDILLNR